MTPSNWDRIDGLFHEALDLEPGARDAFLSQACGDDAALLREVTEMLVAHGDSGRLQLEDRLLNAQAEGPLVGRRIGAYELERLIGRGGMGDVYLAHRCDDQFEHQVAFKLMRDGLPGQNLTDRFLLERQILAQLDHPHIATLLDGGMTDDGRPYLVMQYVDGIPVTEYCVANRMNLTERLALFRTICQAVQVAHTNLVVHRDLKPGNILVTAQGDVKLLDFGIAKLLGPAEAGATIALDRILTPEHAAPEQVTGGKVTTATDVYALGVLLYELLTETRPFQVTATSSAAVERVICETVPVAPSQRQGGFARALRGELDNIVLMALRKEPERRYQSARELDEDIAAYLGGRPVRAQRDTVSYRAKKFIQRNRWGVTAVGVFLVLASGFVISTLAQSRSVATRRDWARAEQVKTNNVVDVLADLLVSADPHTDREGKAVSQEEFVTVIGDAVDGLSEQPDVQARLWELLAQVHRARSQFDQARDYLNQALAYHKTNSTDPLAQARIQHVLALLTMQTEGPEAAVPLFRASLDRHRQLLGESHPDVGIATQDLAGALMQVDPVEAYRLLEQAKVPAAAYSHRNPLAMASIHNRLGALMLERGEPEKAQASFEQALALMRDQLGDEHPHVLTVEHNLAVSLGGQGQWADAATLHRRILAVRRQNFDPDTVQIGRSLDSLAGVLAYLGQFEEAMAGFAEAERIFGESLGPQSGQVSSILRNMAVVEGARGRAEAALSLLDRALAADVARGEDNTRSFMRKRGDRVLIRFTLGEQTAAIGEARTVLAAIDTLATGYADSYRADMRTILATMLLASGGPAEAADLLHDAIAIRGARTRDSHPKLAREYCLLGVALVQAGDTDPGRTILKQHQGPSSRWQLAAPFQDEMIADALRQVGISSP